MHVQLPPGFPADYEQAAKLTGSLVCKGMFPDVDAEAVGYACASIKTGYLVPITSIVELVLPH